MQRGLVEQVRKEAETRGVQWAALLDRAGLSKASRSRLNIGVAGISTIGRIRRALDELTVTNVPSPSRDDARDEPEDTRKPLPIASIPGRRRRWVVVQCKDRQMFFGIVAASDDEITERVRLERCRPILSIEISAASLASVGPTQRGIVGPEAPSALIYDVAVIYDATKAAVREFELRK